MVRIVAFWRCECGTRVKVIAEADSPPATTIASCPRCGHRHSMHADKIIFVTEDMSEGSPAVPCAEKERLLFAQKQAFDIYMRGVSDLAEAVGMMAHTEFEFLANQVEAARQFFLETRTQLNEHAAKHLC